MTVERPIKGESGKIASRIKEVKIESCDVTLSDKRAAPFDCLFEGPLWK